MRRVSSYCEHVLIPVGGGSLGSSGTKAGNPMIQSVPSFSMSHSGSGVIRSSSVWYDFLVGRYKTLPGTYRIEARRYKMD